MYLLMVKAAPLSNMLQLRSQNDACTRTIGPEEVTVPIRRQNVDTLQPFETLAVFGKLENIDVLQLPD